MSAEHQVIDQHLAMRSPPEIACAYKALCSAALVKTATLLASKGVNNWATTKNREVARKWIEGGRGVLEFNDCCAVLDLEPDYARRAILRYAESQRNDPIKNNRARRQSHFVFGRSIDAREMETVT